MFSVDFQSRSWLKVREHSGICYPFGPSKPASLREKKSESIENPDAVLALQTLGLDKSEAKRQVQEALRKSPGATTQEIIAMCFNPKNLM